jgi:hypothetical protein
MADAADMFAFLGVGVGTGFDPFKIGTGKKSPFPPGHESAEALLDHLTDYARTIYLAPDATAETQLRPMVIACCANGDVVPLVNVGLFDADEKDAWADMCRKVFKEWNVKHYGLIVEAWAATPRADDLTLSGGLKENAMRPSERDDRVEVVMITAEDRRGRTKGRTLEIVRDYATGKVADLRPILEDIGEEAMLRGRFASLLKEPEPIAQPVHPCANEEVLNRHHAVATMLSLIPEIRDLGDRREEFVARAYDLNGRLMLHFDRVRTVPVHRLKGSPDVRDYERTMREVQTFLLELMPFMPQEIQQKVRSAKQKMEQ